MTRFRFLLALAVTVMCFILLVGSDANATPLRNIILVIIYVASAVLATHEALEVRHE
ncbi:hypothetical protein [Bifidobacterium mongoliense]|uniref:hypothetical protein n=1 Tax=Bifidobacterium mongoliense TaxID=518643 RepID=UPI002646FD27|nr:hypothetical protein [Bifidobacterium mongoliense]MDN6024744.1 hypothetical protein [Bifidobacterium mongoliense]MDN6719169.1 hypothetical protein [Bifidobacterium mongoliense]